MGRKHTAINWECVALFLYMLGQMRSLGWPLIWINHSPDKDLNMWKEDLLVQLLERISALECPSLQKPVMEFLFLSE